LFGAPQAASVGASFVIAYGLAGATSFAVPLAGILGALVSIGGLVAIAGRRASLSVTLLAGLALASLAGAGTALILNLAPTPYAALEIAFWLLGSLEDRSFTHVWLAAGPLALAWLVLLGSTRMLEALPLGEDVARTLGVPLGRGRLQVIAGVGIGVGAAVAVSGVIGFIGLVVPHLVRPLVGHRPGAALVPSALGGAGLLLAADLVVRVVPTTAELKVGVVTALIGVPFFLALVLRLRRRLT
jgi:iron complex transport system permease protein